MNLSSKKIIGILLIILTIVNYALFLIFQQINPNLTIYAQIFGYLESRPFQAVTISFILPILLFLIDHVFKIREKAIEEKKQRQMESINRTEDLWKDLSELTSEFIYAKKFDGEKIAELHSKIDKFIINAEEVVNSWHFEFANLRKILGDEIDFTDIYLAPFNVLLSSISSLIDFRNIDYLNEDIEKTRAFQEYILIIYLGIKGGSHQRMINLLHKSMLFSEKNDEMVKQEIETDYNFLRKFSLKLIKEIYENYPFKSSDSDFKDINAFLEKMKSEIDYDYEEFKGNFEIYYNSLPDDKKISFKNNYQFSDDLIIRFAFILKFQELSGDINHTRKQYHALMGNRFH